MDFYLGLLQIIGVHTLLGLSAYVVLVTGQVSMAQAGFCAIGAYVAAMGTAILGLYILPAIVLAGLVTAAIACVVVFPALRVKGLMLVVATLAFGEMMRLFFFNFTWQVERGEELIGPDGAEGFRAIRFFPENGWEIWHVAGFIRIVVAVVMGALVQGTCREGGRVMLTLENLSKHSGGVRAVDDVSLTIREGEIFGLIGPNGSGKRPP